MRKCIIGTDWWDDCDDAVALRVLIRAHMQQQIQVEGVVINACMEDSVSSLDGFLAAEGITNIPIGLDRQATDYTGRLTYQKRLVPLRKKYLNFG